MEKDLDLVAVADIRRGDYVYSSPTIRHKIRLGLIPSFRVANRLYVERSVLEELGRPIAMPARSALEAVAP